MSFDQNPSLITSEPGTSMPSVESDLGHATQSVAVNANRVGQVSTSEFDYGVTPQLADYRQIPIPSITVGPRFRKLRSDKLRSLMESIDALGLTNAIAVVTGPPDENGRLTFELVDGNHRLEAFKRLGRTVIPAHVLELNSITRQLAEIDANLCRADLTALERSEHLLRRKELYEELYPQTRQHLAGAVAANAAMGRGDATDKLSVAAFAADTAAKMGFTDRNIRREISRATKIDQAVRDRIREMPAIADNGSELDALAALEPSDQRRVVDLFESKKCKSIKGAKQCLHHDVSPPRPTPVKESRFKTAGAAVTVVIPKSKLDDATPDPAKQQTIYKLCEIIVHIPQPHRSNLIGYLDKLGTTRADKLAACVLQAHPIGGVDGHVAPIATEASGDGGFVHDQEDLG